MAPGSATINTASINADAPSRAGDNLETQQRNRLEAAKGELCKAFGKPEDGS